MKMAAGVPWVYFLLWISSIYCVFGEDITCEDGTYGYECEFMCACRDEAEVCLKDTGECPISGCKKGTWGSSCHLAKNCYYEFESERGQRYMGFVTRTKNKNRCIAWTSQLAQRVVKYKSDNFPDETIEDARNYCRAPIEGTMGPREPWCYIGDQYPYYEYCNIKNCGCVDGRFGINCEQTCHCKENRPCHKKTGVCPNNACHQDWTGSNCQTVIPKITYFYNVKVNPRVSTTNLTCVVRADPRPAPGDIYVSQTGEGVLFQTDVTEMVGLYSTSKTFIDVEMSRRSEFLCSFSRDVVLSKTTTAEYFVLPQLRQAPYSGRTLSRSIQLMWRRWTHGVDLGDPPITKYKLLKAESGSGKTETLSELSDSSCGGALCVYQINGLKPSTTYLFQVVTSREGPNGEGDASPLAQITTECDVPSAPPTIQPGGMSLTGKNNLLVRTVFKWTLPDKKFWNCNYVTKIQFFLHKSSEPVTGPFQEYNGNNVLSYTNYKMEPNTRYEAFVRFMTRSGLYSPNSTVYHFLTMESKPSAPVNLNVILRNSSALVVTWEEPEMPRGVINGYKVLVSKLVGTSAPKIACNLRNRNVVRKCVVKDLDPFTNYTIQVQAVTNAGRGDWSPILHGYTEEGKPEEPRGLTNVSRTEGSVFLTWEPPFKTNGNLMKYEVKCVHINNPAMLFSYHDPWPVQVMHDVLQHNVTGLMSGTAYFCTVKGRTGKGLGGAAKIEVRTLPARPPKPQTPEVLKTKVTDSTITIKLSSVANSRFYRIVVHQLTDSSVEYEVRRRRRRSLPSEDELASKKDPNFYIAAHLTEIHLVKPFVVGDGKVYGGYENKPLLKGKKYDIYFGAGNSNDGVTFYTYSKISEPQLAVQYVAPVEPIEEEVEKSDSSGAIAGAIVVVILMIIIAGLVAVLLVRRRRRKQQLEITKTDDEETGEKRALTAVVKEEDSDTEDETTNLNTTVDNEPLYTNVGEIRHSVPIDELEEYIKDMKLCKNEKFKHEYQQIPWGLTAPCEVAKKQENRHKNRYGNIVAYDHSRVVLDQLEGVRDSDYINADYMDGYTRLKAYIATQGPSKQTAADLWRMAWQENSTKIVMVTNLVEDGRRKCEMYWPEEGTKEYGSIAVRLVAVERRADFIIRTFEMTKGNQKRPIKQYHFTAWPDHGAPAHATPLLGFWRKVRSYEVPDAGPILCHCSAGVGRTGTFIALDYLMDQADTEGKINVYSYVKDMRTKRCNMIQTLEQYIFLHNALLEAIKSGNTCIPAAEFVLEHATLNVLNSDTKKTPLQEQFELLRELIMPLNMSRVKSALETDNSGKNRDPTIVPYNSCRPYLMTPIEGGTDYINAVFIDSYRNKDEFIATQHPLPNTVVDFWRMLYDHHSSVVVMLNEANEEDESYAKYWPEDITSVDYGPFTVEMVAPPITNSTVTMREFKMTYPRRPSEEPHHVKQFQLNCWPDNDDLVSSPSVLLDLMTTVFQASQSGPITVHCRNGAEHCGLFISGCYITEKLTLEREVDVFQAVKHICINRPHLVSNFEQYKFCYQLVQGYLDSDQTESIYGNVLC